MVRKAGVRSRASGVRVFGVRVSGVTLIVSGLVLLLAPITWRLTPAVAQQPQAQQGQPLYTANAKYVNGVAPGYWPTQGSGLTLNVSAGSAICANAPVSYAGGTLTLAASATNYVYLDMTRNCIPALSSGGSGFPATGLPIAVVTTSSSAITAISDVRTWFAARPVVDPGGQTYNVKAYGATGNGSTDDTAAIQATLSAAAGGGSVLFPPGRYLVSSQIAIQISNLELRGYGATLLCNVAANCMLLGDLVHVYDYNHISIEGLGFSPTANSAGYAALEDDAMGSRIVNVKPINNSSYTFARIVQVDNDQAGLISGLDMSLGTSTLSCTSSACGYAIYGMQGGAYAGLFTVLGSNLSMGCNGNGIYWGGGPLDVIGTVIQAFAEGAIFGVASQAGGIAQISTYGGDIEAGACTNPMGNIGQMGVLVQGRTLEDHNTPIGGNVPAFPQNGTTGSTFYQYWVVPHGAAGVGSPLAIGYLTNGNTTINATNSVTVTFPPPSDMTSFDLLRQIYVSGNPAPYGTGNYAIATGLSTSTYCISTLCTYTDTTTTPSSYTISPYSTNYVPFLSYWPGGVVLSPLGSSSSAYSSYIGKTNQSIVDANGVASGGLPGRIVETGGENWWFGSPIPYSPLTESSLGYHSQSSGPFALLLPSENGWQVGRKGSLNLGQASGVNNAPTDVVTLYDSNYGATLSVPGHRPPFNTGDSAICQDVRYGSSAICLRTGSTLSFYVNSLPLGSKWSAQLGSAGWAWAVSHYGLSSQNTGAPATPTLTDVKSSTGWAANTAYAQYAIIYDGANFELALMGGTSGTTPPTWSTTPGQTVTDGWFNGPIIWQCLGPGTSLSPNTTYYVKVAATTLTGKSLPSGEASITTANDSNLHIILASATNTSGATGYQVGCSTTSGAEALLSPPFSGAYTGGAYQLPIMSCSGSGSFNSSDTTGYASFPGLYVGGGTAINAMNLYNTGSITPTAVSGASCSDQTFTVTGLLAADRISNITPPSALGNVSLNAYASAAGTVLLHFCNPSSLSVTPPAGVYSFLAVH